MVVELEQPESGFWCVGAVVGGARTVIVGGMPTTSAHDEGTLLGEKMRIRLTVSPMSAQPSSRVPCDDRPSCRRVSSCEVLSSYATRKDLTADLVPRRHRTSSQLQAVNSAQGAHKTAVSSGCPRSASSQQPWPVGSYRPYRV